MHPNNAELFSAATEESWGTSTMKNVGPEARGVEMLRDHTRVNKNSVDSGEVEVWWKCCI